MIQPSQVRYIKLGRGGEWERICLELRVNRIGFWTSEPEVFELCGSGKWSELEELFIRRGRTPGVARRFANEVRIFFEDDGTILWITFIGERLYWGQAVTSKPTPAPELLGVSRPMRDGWHCEDLLGEALTKDKLSGALTKLAMYRGTSCDVGDVKDYVVRRVNGQKTPEIERALQVSKDMEASALELMRLLHPRDFETLVDLLFSTSGWRRLGVVGGPEKTRDLDIVLPSTGERAFVQVKSTTNQAELDSYINRIRDGPYDRMFFVHHSGNVATSDQRVRVIGPERLAEMVVDAGLIDWLIRKVG
jgi:hypothetical protein